MRDSPNWPAIGALAGLVGALIALLTYITPNSGHAPAVAATAPATTPAYSQPPEPAPTQPAPTKPGESLRPVGNVTPPGCSDAMTAIRQYERTAGSSKSSEDAAATQAYEDLMGAGTEASGGVHTTIVTLAGDFSNLRWILEGALDQSTGPVISDINSNISTLNSECTAS